jgi:hypothetical protein
VHVASDQLVGFGMAGRWMGSDIAGCLEDFDMKRHQVDLNMAGC